VSVTVIGMWELDWLLPRLERRLWKQTLAAYGIKNWAMVPGDTERGSPLEFNSLEEALTKSHGTRVFLRPDSGIPLSEFDHPIDAVYIFGNAKESLRKYIRQEDNVVTIDCPQATDMFACVALAPVLHSRFVQHGC